MPEVKEILQLAGLFSSVCNTNRQQRPKVASNSFRNGKKSKRFPPESGFLVSLGVAKGTEQEGPSLSGKVGVHSLSHQIFGLNTKRGGEQREKRCERSTV